MSFVVSGKIVVEGAQAKAELAAAAGATKQLGAAAAELDRSARTAAQGTRALEGAATAAAADIRGMAQAAGVAEAQNVGLARSSQQAAGAVGNMTAQFNDIFMMVAAGQNPMQLAIQQGTQITQAFGGAGAAGALRMMGAGFMSMLNPMNLATIGAIAAGAAFIQWLTNASEQAVTLEGALGELEGAVSELQAVTDLLSDTDLRGLKEEFGEISAEVLHLLGLQRELALMDAMRGTADAIAAMTESFDGWMTTTLDGIKNSFDTTYDNARTLQALMEDVAAAATPEEALQAVITLRQQIESTVGPLSSLSGPAYEMARGLVEAEANLRRVVTEADRAEAGLDRAGAAADALANSGPGAGWMSAAIGETNALISRLVEADRLKRGLAGLQAVETQGLAAQYAQYGAGREAFNQGARESSPLYSPFSPAAGDGAGGGGGGAAATRTETDAVEKLIARKQQELELLRMTDPVMREMVRNRELLATATDAQRTKVEEVTAALEREKAVQQASDFFASGASGLLSSIVTESASAGEALDNLIQKLIDAGIQAMMLGTGPLAGAFGTAGTSIFGALFGGGGRGVGSFGLPKPFADGGPIYGRGGPRDDKELIYASPGEFMVNARAASRNRALLEFLNAGGTLRGFADGGAISGGGGVVGVPGVGPSISMPISIDARGAQRGVGDEIARVVDRQMGELQRRLASMVNTAIQRGEVKFR